MTKGIDASIVFKLQTMFLRLICDNGMKSTESFNSSIRRHTTNFQIEKAFEKLKGLSTSFNKLRDQFEVYQSVKLTRDDVNKLFKSFSKGSEGKEYLLNKVLEDKKIITLCCIFGT